MIIRITAKWWIGQAGSPKSLKARLRQQTNWSRSPNCTNSTWKSMSFARVDWSVRLRYWVRLKITSFQIKIDLHTLITLYVGIYEKHNHFITFSPAYFVDLNPFVMVVRVVPFHPLVVHVFFYQILLQSSRRQIIFRGWGLSIQKADNDAFFSHPSELMIQIVQASALADNSIVYFGHQMKQTLLSVLRWRAGLARGLLAFAYARFPSPDLDTFCTNWQKWTRLFLLAKIC